jgi:pyruvate dehydrogenase E2 component (dihydrolipoamide acetyltransferase)
VAHAVRMPALGTTTDELRIVEWLKRVGEEVGAGEPLFVVESDKATLEVEATAPGTLLAIQRQPGDTVDVGAVVAYLGPAGEEPPAEAPAGRVEASPAVRKLAREHGIDLAAVQGSGPGGRVERDDVLALAGTASEAGEPVPPHRQAVARRLGRSVSIPQFSVGVTVDMTSAAAGLGAPGVTYTHVLLRALAATLRAHPELGSVWVRGPRLRRLPRPDVGLAVAGPDSLHVVTIPEPDRLEPAALVEHVERAAAEARAGRISEHYAGPAAVILSNLGGIGVDRFTAILDPDATAVLAAGRVTERPAVRDRELRVTPQLDLTLTVDHRVADGVAAGRFLAALRDRLEGGVESPTADPPAC